MSRANGPLAAWSRAPYLPCPNKIKADQMAIKRVARQTLGELQSLQAAYQILFNQHTRLQRKHIELQDRYLALLIMLDRENAPSETIPPAIN
jgi:hypothetical protein